jgi:hypothetical protein
MIIKKKMITNLKVLLRSQNFRMSVRGRIDCALLTALASMFSSDFMMAERPAPRHPCARCRIPYNNSATSFAFGSPLTHFFLFLTVRYALALASESNIFNTV